MTRKVAVVSVSRADRAMTAVVAGALSAEAVDTVALVVDDPSGPDSLVEDRGVRARRLAAGMTGDDPASLGRRMGALTGAFAQALDQERPQLVVLTGDRYETLAAAGAATLSGALIAHLHGGEITRGAMDDAFRHAITKMAHLHFCATEAARARLRALGEADWRITVSGAPGLDLLNERPTPTRAAFFQALGRRDPGPFLLASWHPETLAPDGGAAGLEALLEGLAGQGRAVLFTGVNADPGGAAQAERIRRWAEGRTDVSLIPNLGPLYGPALAHADALVGNSSSGVIEAASFALPVVDVGDRQGGRDRGPNVLHAAARTDDVAQALGRALDPRFRAGLAGMTNPYGDGRAGPRIAARLAAEPLSDRLRRKSLARMEPST